MTENIHKDCENYSPKKDYCLKIIEEHRKQETEYTARLEEENKQLQKDCTALIYNNQEYRKENERLKKDNTNLHRAMSKERVNYLKFRDKVFDLLDIKETDTIGAEVLKNLRRELIE